MSDVPPVLPSESPAPPVLGQIAAAQYAWTPQQGVPPGSESPLTARPATITLLAWFAGQVFGGMLVAVPIGFVEGVKLGMHHARTPIFQQLASMKPPPNLWGAFVGVIVGGLVMVYQARQQFGARLSDRSPTGSAWVRGRWGHILAGLGVGILVGLAAVVVVTAFKAMGVHPRLGPLAKMAQAPGISRALWLVMALLLAPPIEELLFRGVLYAGYRRTMGAPAAAALTTAIFVLMHLPEVIGFLPAMIGIAGFALAAIWIRLRTAAIGPAIAVHFGYNLVVAVGILCSA